MKVTKEIMQNYKEHSSEDDTYDYNREYKTYDYQEYLDRLKVLFMTKNGLQRSQDRVTDERYIDNNIDVAKE